MSFFYKVNAKTPADANKIRTHARTIQTRIWFQGCRKLYNYLSAIPI